MPIHSRVKGQGFLCEATGKLTNQVWSDHARWAKEGHAYNECCHCSESGQTSIGNMLHALNEKAKAEHESKNVRAKRGRG